MGKDCGFELGWRKRWLLHLMTGFFLILPVLLLDLDAGQMSSVRMTREIDRFLNEHFKPAEPGISVLAVFNGRVVLRKGYGMADMENGVRMSPEHVFRIGSITKQFTAAAIMMMAEEGKLKLSDPIALYLKDYPTQGHNITIKHLLNHTSGIKSYTEIQNLWEKKLRLDVNVDELIDYFKKEPMDFAPGDRWLYDNSGYVLLGAIIEKASGKSYEDFIRERVFQSLGMKNSYYGSHITIIPRRTAGYQKTKDGYANCDFISMKLPYAAGALLSTVDDLYVWNQALDAGRVVTKESLASMTTPTILNNGTIKKYGFGLDVSDFYGYRQIAHGGGIPGFSTYAMQIPEKKIFVAVLSNCPGMEPAPQFIAQWIASLMLGKPVGEKKPVKLDDKALESYVGVYQIGEGDYREVIREGNQLYTMRTNGPRFPIYPESSSIFYYTLSLSRLTFVRGPDGKVIKMVMTRPEGDEEALRVEKKEDEKATSAGSVFADLVGEYGEKDGFKISIYEAGDKLMARGSGQPAIEIIPESKDQFDNQEMGIRLEFRRDASGKITGFYLYQRGMKIIMDRN